MNTSVANKSQSAVNWLTGFVDARSNRTKPITALYEYHMTNEEYRSLNELLRASMQFEIKHSFSKEWCGAFTLYCSEWFRREYSQDWSWQSIFKTLSFTLSPTQISDVVVRGLTNYWNKPISKFSASHSDYLGSVFLEGGLPSNLLSSDSNHYQAAFFSIFERYQDAKDIGSDAIYKLIQGRISGFPETLQGERTVELIASMIDKLDSLAYQFELDKESKPAEYLDIQFPRWRESFPLPLENSTGSAFLSQLLSTASKEVSKVAKIRKALGCKHYISFSNQAVFTEITLPHSCTFELSKEQLSSSRVEIAIFEGDVQIASLGAGFAQFNDNNTSIRMRNALVEVRRHHSESELYIVAMQAGCKLAEIRIEASAVDIGESPVTLIEKIDKWQVLSQSSVLTKKTKVGILLPESATVDLVYGNVSKSELMFGELLLTILNGKCEVHMNQDEKYVITTNSDSFQNNNFVLKGDQLPWKSIPALVFKGIPTVHRYSINSELDYTDNVSIYLDKTPLGSLSQSESNGRQLLTARTEDGLIQLRKRIGVLPKDFDIQLCNGDKPNQGIIKVKTMSPCVCKIVSDKVTIRSSKILDGIKEFCVDAVGKPPSTITVHVMANILSAPILIEVPFPAKGAVAYNRHGKTLPDRLTVDDLLGSRLHLFSTRGIPANFQVEAIVSSNRRGNHNNPYFRWNYRVTDKPVEVSLYALKESILELLSLTEQLDSEVDLHVTGPGKTLNFTINHYSTILEHDRAANTVSLRSKALLDAENVKLMLMSLSAPDQKPINLLSRQSEGVDTGEYELPSCVKENGPWLIIPAEKSDVTFRAKFLFGGESKLNDGEVKSLQKASKLYHPQYNSNVISDVLKQMSSDWSHSGWQYMKDTFANYGYLPLSTFEVWRHLVRDQRALAVALFIFENDEKFITQLESELPILWEFISIDNWQHAVTLMRNTLDSVGLPEPLVEQLSKNQIDKLGQAIPALSGTVVDYLINGTKPINMPVPLIQHMSEGWFQELLHLHSEDNSWPTEYSAELKQCCTNLNLLPFDLKVNVSFQMGVVYLPLFAAAMTSDLIPSVVCNSLPTDSVFHLRKLRDFDREWFESMYRCFINYFANNSK
ncbi:STY4851/ECs_5259 family protein [Aliivibrio finisterrensis]|nr:STY4851/ECs_5259 family protein [Aliivibrio finisterrensis]